VRFGLRLKKELSSKFIIQHSTIRRRHAAHVRFGMRLKKELSSKRIIQHNTIRRRHCSTCEVRAEAEERVEQQAYNTA